MSSVSSLSPSCFDHPSLFQFIEHGFKQQMLCMSMKKPGAKLAEDREIKAFVFQLEAQCVLPLNTHPNCLGGLTIREPFCKLHDGHQGQSPRRERWLTIFGKQVGKHLILKKDPQFISHSNTCAPLRARRFGDASGYRWNGSNGIWLE